jgi:hypothetical protein
VIETRIELEMKIECDICGKVFEHDTTYESTDTDMISMHSLEDLYMEDQGFTMSNNTCYCKDCKL